MKSNLKIVSKDVEKVIPKSPCLVIFAVPGFAHEAYLRAIRPHLTDGSVIGAMPGEGAFDVAVHYVFENDKQWLESLNLKPLKYDIWAMDTLPWACRISEYGKSVDLLATKAYVDVAIYPPSRQDAIVKTLQNLLGGIELKPISNILAVTLGRFWHPIITYGYYRNRLPLEKELDAPPLFYESIDTFTAEKISAVSDEILEVKKTLLSRYPTMNLASVVHVKDWMLASYGEEIADKTNLQTMLNTNHGYLGLTHPTVEVEVDGKKAYMPNFKYRYLSEDIPFGLVVARGIAELADVKTPNIDEVIIWAQERLGKQYLSLNTVGGTVKGTRDMHETRCPQRYGFENLDEFIKANHYNDKHVYRDPSSSALLQ
mmetsp:Transcript_10555/g.12037  ORF Transcript_10555/g.12037 Transcript_10555/m.12037 type:complete len:371 (+) Transcript_10555:444-1556(+)